MAHNSSPSRPEIPLPAASRELRRAREAAGLTQTQLALLADCSVQYLSMIERGTVPKRRDAHVLGHLFAALEGLKEGTE